MVKILNVVTSYRPRIVDRFVFHPSTEPVSIPDEIGGEEVLIQTKDGETLYGCFFKAKKETDKTVIFLHGNAGNMSGWSKVGAKIRDDTDANVLITDYRGYGNSTGTPTRKGVIKDAQAMYEYLVQERGILGGDISISGVSLGGSIGVELASKLQQENKPLRALIIQSAFTSLREITKIHFPKIPSFLVPNKLLNSLKLIRELNIPVLIIHGDEDEIIPYEQSVRLYEAANEPKRLIVLRGAHHTDVFSYYGAHDCFKVIKEIIGV